MSNITYGKQPVLYTITDVTKSSPSGADLFFRLHVLADSLHAEQNGTQTRYNGTYNKLETFLVRFQFRAPDEHR